MDAFESVAATLFELDGYWVRTSFKVELTKSEKRRIGRPSSPRWELDIVAYGARTNEVLSIECKSYLDSRGVTYESFIDKKTTTLKLFRESTTRDVVLHRLYQQMLKDGLCRRGAKVRLCLFAGKIATEHDRKLVRQYFDDHGWMLFDETWILNRLKRLSEGGYQNQVAAVVTKMLLRSP